MRTVQHRIIWWLVDVGAPGYMLKHGWQQECATQLSIHRITLHRQVELMIGLGILFEGEKKGEIIVNTEIFRPAAQTRRLRKEKVI